jgi:hypothetical protein
MLGRRRGRLKGTEVDLPARLRRSTIISVRALIGFADQV